MGGGGGAGAASVGVSGGGHSSLEQGLGFTVTKIGPGEKEEAYAMPKYRVMWFLAAIVAALVLLSILVGIYAGLFNDERIRRMFQEKKALEKIGEEKVDAVRLGMAIHQQEAEREHQEYDTKRALKRIMSVVSRKFDELMSETKDEKVLKRLRDSKSTLTSFVSDELKDFEKEKKAYDAEAKKRFEKLAKFQEESLRELLKSVSGVKMAAMEDMLEEVFAAGQKAPKLEVSDEAEDEIEALADSMYEGKTELETGRQRLETLKLQIFGTLPDDLVKSFAEATDADAFAEALDELVEITKLARGKKEIAAIEEQWRANVDKARLDAQNNDDEEDGAYDEEIKHNVDALLAVQKLVAQGKVPVYLLDFEAIDLKDLQDGADEGDDDQEGDEEQIDKGSDDQDQQQGDEDQQQQGEQANDDQAGEQADEQQGDEQEQKEEGGADAASDADQSR